MDWFSIAWIAGTLAIIIYAIWQLNRESRRRKRASETLEMALTANRLTQINQPAEIERNEQLRREGKIW